MIIDGLLNFEPTPSAVTAITTTADSTNIIDLLNARDVGIGEGMRVVVYSGAVVFLGGTSLNIQLKESVDNITYYVASESGVMTLAQMTAQGNPAKLWETPIPHRPIELNVTMPRYLKLTYLIVGTFTAGGVWAGIVKDSQAAAIYPPGIVITN
jgi:hypothetical protein